MTTLEEKRILDHRERIARFVYPEDDVKEAIKKVKKEIHELRIIKGFGIGSEVIEIEAVYRILEKKFGSGLVNNGGSS